MRIVCLAGLVSAVFFAPAGADTPLLCDIIAAYNTDALEKSVKKGTYRGEEGILRIGPDVGRELGLDTFVNADYRQAKAFYVSADRIYEDAWRILRSARSQSCNDARIKRLARLAAAHNAGEEAAGKRMLAYHVRVPLEADQRLDRQICMALMERLLKKSFAATGNNLRDALGHFYNTCSGENPNGPHLSPENIRFVNYVFRSFSARASKKDLGDTIWTETGETDNPYLRMHGSRR